MCKKKDGAKTGGHILHIPDPQSGTVEVEVTEEFYCAYRRLGYNADYRDKKFRRHETPFSGLVGGENGSFDNFHEFGSDDDDPQTVISRTESIVELIEAIGKLTDEEIRLLKEFFLSGKSERGFAAESGVPHMTFRNRKRKILKKLRRMLSER